MRKIVIPSSLLFIIFLCTLFNFFSLAFLPATATAENRYTIFDDKMLLDGYAEKYQNEPKEILLAIIEDETLSSYKTAAAVRVFREKFSQEIFSREKKAAERILWRRLNRTDSIFVQIEIMYTLCVMDRYKFFKYFAPSLIQALDHYNTTVNELAYNALQDLIKTSHNKPREARIIFNALRKTLFLSRRKLRNITKPGKRLEQKLELVRWSVKILGTDELKRLPSEVLNFL